MSNNIILVEINFNPASVLFFIVYKILISFSKNQIKIITANNYIMCAKTVLNETPKSTKGTRMQRQQRRMQGKLF